MSQPLLQVKQVSLNYGEVAAVISADLHCQQGEVVMLCGPSGCGKTSLLRLIGGLEEPTSGSIHLNGSLLVDKRKFVPPEKRPISMVFQSNALFPHLRAKDNVGFGVPKKEREQRAAEMLQKVGASEYAERFPHELSGGQQQRIAIARALAVRPKLLLMDEPFSDLDGEARHQVREQVLKLIRSEGIAAIIVTHDMQDAEHIADAMVLMDGGRTTIRRTMESQ